MQDPEFDAYAADYHRQHQDNIRLTGEDPSYFADYKIAQLRRVADSAGMNRPDILDFGSGIGNSLPGFRRHFPQNPPTCADVSGASLDLAQQRFPGDERHVQIKDRRLPFDDHSFDLVFTACVFHHIPWDEHPHWLQEMRRVTRPGGKLMVFEHNPLNPLTVRAVNTCPFDENARLLSARVLRDQVAGAGWQDVVTEYHVFFPAPLAGLRRADRFLRWCPLGGQHLCLGTAPATDGPPPLAVMPGTARC